MCMAMSMSSRHARHVQCLFSSMTFACITAPRCLALHNRCNSRIQCDKGAWLCLPELGRERAAHQGTGGEAQADEPARNIG